jgi:hypothetical protein
MATLRDAALRALPPSAINPKTGNAYAAARIQNPDDPTLYYRQGGIVPWVRTGYTVWSIGLWLERFGPQYSNGEDARSWQFFGETIDLWPPGSDGYSDE